jgi:hypothetical protein
MALIVRSIGEGAGLAVKTAGNGAPIFAATSEGAGGPPVRKSDPLDTETRTASTVWLLSDASPVQNSARATNPMSPIGA